MGQRIRRLVELDTREVSPVLRGASIGTGTLSAKAEGEDPPPLADRIQLVTGDPESQGHAATISDILLRG